MSIKDMLEKIKGSELITVVIIILVGTAGFGFGQLSAKEKNREEVRITKPPPVLVSTAPVVGTTTPPYPMRGEDKTKDLLVASKSGKKYHFPSCPGALQIAEKNKIWFATYEEAQKAGYTAAANCPGLN